NGIWGNEKPPCEKLKLVEHCRNCDVFAEAARAEIVKDSVDFYSDGDALSIDDLVQKQRLAGDKSILPFRLEKYCFAIPSKKIITIHDQIPIHSIPFNRNPVIKGVVAINHEIYTFVNIVDLLSLPPSEKSEIHEKTRGFYKRVLVVDFDSRILAFYVDEVYQIFRYYHQAVNEEMPGSFLNSVSKGRLLEEKDWCDDCHILDLKKISSEFENTFL
ncbi:MAG: chemotaxis protein CheW, partial [Gammaproteobacteria bacterium]|nr:chemotaxis protein CheW [Gammaproteobacteria bacterium]